MSAKTFLHNLPVPPWQVVGMITSGLLDGIRPAYLPGPRTAQRATGSALMLAGCAITGWALVERRRHAEQFDLDRPPSLVMTGPYAASRHPMYVGWWLIHLGFGVLRGSTWVLVTVPSAVLLEHPAVLAEESRLAQEFGNEFVRYAERVPRYLPLPRVHAVTVHGAAVDPK